MDLKNQLLNIYHLDLILCKIFFIFYLIIITLNSFLINSDDIEASIKLKLIKKLVSFKLSKFLYNNFI